MIPQSERTGRFGAQSPGGDAVVLCIAFDSDIFDCFVD